MRLNKIAETANNFGVCQLYPWKLDELPHALTPDSPMPGFPSKAAISSTGGTVDFVFTIEADGSISNIRQVQEYPTGYGFGATAFSAVQKFHYTPARLNGEPVAVDCWPLKVSLSRTISAKTEWNGKP